MIFQQKYLENLVKTLFKKMKRRSTETEIYEELKQSILSKDSDKVLQELKNRLKNVAVPDRRNFEIILLKLSLDKKIEPFRKIIYETLSSLDSIWTEHLPKRELISKFWSAYNEKKYHEAGQICSELIMQGLDYIGTINSGEGKLLPIQIKDNNYIFQYNEKKMDILDTELKIVIEIYIKGKIKIIDVLPPNKHSQNRNSDINRRVWILREDSRGNRSIVALREDLKDFDDKTVVKVDKNLMNANQLSRFQSHLLLISRYSIYYFQENKGWKEWFNTKEEITCTKEGENHYWVGYSNGHVWILKSLEREGVRKINKAHSDIIKSIDVSEKYALISSKNASSIIDTEANSVLKLIEVESKIIQSKILNKDTAILLHANGMLIGREIKQGNVLWRINLGNFYDSLFTIGRKIFCHKIDEKLSIFEIPHIESLTENLKEKGIYLIERPIEKDPKAPIRNISEFIGREKILDSIKKFDSSHFLISGAPKTGKTSLLHVLRDILYDNSVCVYIDMNYFLEVENFEYFETNFINECLHQHGLKLEDLKPHKGIKIPEGYQKFRLIVEKVRGSKKYCVFCLDNFHLTEIEDSEEFEKFDTFMRELFVHPDIRIIATYCKKYTNDIKEYFNSIIINVSVERDVKKISLPLFSEMEARDAIRRIGELPQITIEEIYQYTGRFPHLIRFYEGLNIREKSIKTYSKEMAVKYCETILDYFGDISSNALLLLGTLLHRDLISKKIGFDNFYQDYPLLSRLTPKSALLNLFDELSSYSDVLIVEEDEDTFSIKIKDEVLLFREAIKHLSWIKFLSALYEFSSNPNWKFAQKIASYYTEIIKSPEYDIPKDEYVKIGKDGIENLTKPYRDDFYIKELTEECRQNLGMPLTTFIVIPLRAWQKGRSTRIFQSLYISIQEYMRKSRIFLKYETTGIKFYILLFAFVGSNFDEISEGTRHLERISVFDPHRMKDIIFDPNPLYKSSEIIFSQLKISERSPYQTAGAVHELFYGRELEIALIRGFPENIGIFGIRTIGKTSLLLRLYQDIKDQPRWKVFPLDCSGIKTEKEFLRNLAEKMNIKPRTISTLEKFRKHITENAKKEEKQYLFLLDEVDGLIEYDMLYNKRIFITFIKMCTERSKEGGYAARFVLFGFHHMFHQMNNPKSRLYNFMVFWPLTALDKESAWKLVIQPMKNIHVKWQNEEKDANYLIDSCSCYPMLLQVICHSLLKILDDQERKSFIERKDVLLAFQSDQFIQKCMRYYEPAILKGIKTESFFEDVHKITILAAIRLHFEEKKCSFTLTEIQNELREYKIEISPGMTGEILARLCLNGTIRLLEEQQLITSNDDKILKDVEILAAEDERINTNKIKVVSPSIYYDSKEKTFVKFQYEFAVKIFPEILVAHFDGIENCKKELKDLIEREQWKDWVRRHFET